MGGDRDQLSQCSAEKIWCIVSRHRTLRSAVRALLKQRVETVQIGLKCDAYPHIVRLNGEPLSEDEKDEIHQLINNKEQAQ